jgi:hypothetical protein
MVGKEKHFKITKVGTLVKHSHPLPKV